MAVCWGVAIIALMMEAGRTSETLVNFYQTTRRYNPEDSHLSFMMMVPNDGDREGFLLRIDVVLLLLSLLLFPCDYLR
jgi:hypothetical protein